MKPKKKKKSFIGLKKTKSPNQNLATVLNSFNMKNYFNIAVPTVVQIKK